MKKHCTGRVSLPTIAATLGLAITLTLNACEEKKKQDGATATEPAAATETQQPSQEAAATTFTDPRDDKTYKTVKIGTQVWMAENLNYKTKEGSICYDEKTENCKKYGRLYDYETAQTACPSGWHLPDSTEWQTLVDFAGGSKNAGKALKATSGWDNNGNGTDKFGFSALPGGNMECRDGCDFYNVGIRGIWVNAVIDDGVFIDEPDIYDKANGASFSVRCLQGDGKEAAARAAAKVAKAAKEAEVAAAAAAAAEKAITEKARIIQADPIKDSRDGKTYKTVKIGSQVWMAENLNYAEKGSKCGGTNIQKENYVDLETREEKTREYYPLEDKNTANCDKYGRLYDWKTAMKACPSGWHLPSQSEWGVLMQAVGGEKTAGKFLKATTGWNTYNGKSGNGTDIFGFSALPGGTGSSDRGFDSDGGYGFWRTAAEDGTSRRITNFGDDTDSPGFGKDDYYSVRCIQN